MGRALGNGRTVQVPSASGTIRFGFDSESGQTHDFKIGIHSFAARQHCRNNVEKPASILSVPSERHLAKFPHRGVVTDGRQLMSELVIELELLSRDRRINIKLNT